MPGINDDLNTQASYSFRVITESGDTPSKAEFGGISPSFTFRMPPQALQIQRSIRAEALKDLTRGISIVTGGEGLGRLTLHGTHGVGAFVDPSLPSEGRDFRERLVLFFQAFINANEARGQKGQEPLRMIWEALGGRWSNPENESYLVWPDGFPTDSRSAARPHAWDWSCSLILLAPWSLGRGTDWAKVTPAPALVDKAGALDTLLADAVKGWKKAQSVLQNVRDLRNKLYQIRTRVQTFTSGAQDAIFEVTNLVSGSAQLCTDILVALRPWDMRDTASMAVQSAVYDVRRFLGEAAITAQQFRRSGVVPDSLTTPQTASLSKPITVAVSPGDTLQGIAARALGDSRRWMEIVRVNGLDYPYLDFSGTNGAPGSAYTALNVAGAATVLKMPLPALAAPVGVADDPIGTDLPDDPSTANLTQGGAENLSAALVRRLLTPRGRIPWHLEYGSMLPTLLGSAEALDNIAAARRDLIDSLKADPRVLDVQNVKVTAQGGVASFYADALTPLGLLPIAGAIP